MTLEQGRKIEGPGEYRIVGELGNLSESLPRTQDGEHVYSIPGQIPVKIPEDFWLHLVRLCPVQQKLAFKEGVGLSRSKSYELVRGHNLVTAFGRRNGVYETYDVYYHQDSKAGNRRSRISINDVGYYGELNGELETTDDLMRKGRLGLGFGSYQNLAWRLNVRYDGIRPGDLLVAAIEWVNDVISENDLRVLRVSKDDN